MTMIHVSDKTFPLAHHGAMVNKNSSAPADTAATTWLRVSDEQNNPIEINSAPTSTIPRYPLKIGPTSRCGRANIASTATYNSVGANNTRKKNSEPRNFPTTTSVSPTGAVRSVSMVPVAHSCASNPIESNGIVQTISQTIQSNKFRIAAICPGAKSSQNRNPQAKRNTV